MAAMATRQWAAGLSARRLPALKPVQFAAPTPPVRHLSSTSSARPRTAAASVWSMYGGASTFGATISTRGFSIMPAIQAEARAGAQAPSPDVMASKADGVSGGMGTSTTPDHLASSSPSEAFSHIGESMVDATQQVQTLADLGQLSSWPNVRAAQWVLDWMVEATGLPWWATIALVTVMVRIMVLPIVLRGQANAIRLANINPRMQEHMQDLAYAKKTGDPNLMNSAAGAVQKLMKDNDCSPFRSFLAPAVQMPVFITFFFALRGLAGAGLTSLKDGGLFWFTDLTLADPLVILPVISCGMTLLVLETGAEMGGAAQTAGPQAKMMRNGLRFLTVVSVLFVWNFPAAVFCFWATNNAFSLLQLVALQTPFIRSRLSLPERKVHDGGAAPKGKGMGFWESVGAGKSSQAAPLVRKDRVPSALQDQRVMDEGREAALQRMMSGQGHAIDSAAQTGVQAEAGSANGNELGTSSSVKARAEEKKSRVQAAREKRASKKRN